MTFAIHPTAEADIPDLARVVTETDLFPAALLPGLLAEAGEALWLSLHRDGAAVGLVFCVPEPLTEGTWNMRALAIRPDMQGRGLGRALVTAAEGRLRADGARLMIVDTSGTEGFAATRAFYARVGYEAEARLRDFWAPGDDKVTFRKALTA
ncbi:GNAT family N-acetyltransferase [Roseobacter sp. HKCCA0434]|uniref:GNAT family N-acetyltransferase n=1 Tax=Roseobacter sp. HKCCA0434 TaxID=3079297 RepID=UPI002905BDAB|nr:GNAT family N-acetyltransferase [Roseobacter sp. HKCCA0434]